MTDPQPARWRIKIGGSGMPLAQIPGDPQNTRWVEVVPLSEAEAKVERLEEARHAYEKERDWLEGKLNECESERDEARAEADRSDGAHARELKARVKAERRVAELEGALERIKDLEERHREWRDATIKAEARIEQLEGALEPLDALIGDLRTIQGEKGDGVKVHAAQVLKKLADIRQALASTPQPSGEARVEDVREEAHAAAQRRYNACLAPRDTTYDPADAMYEAVEAALDRTLSPQPSEGEPHAD